MHLLVTLYTFLLVANTTLLTGSHPFHVSRCEVAYSASEQSLQISLHLFADDVEEALRRQGVDKAFLGTEKERPEASLYLERYLQQHLQFSADSLPVAYQLIGKEPADDLFGLWCYLEARAVSPFSHLRITNTILTATFPNQTNILSLEVPGQPEGYFLFNKSQSTGQATFSP